MAAAAWSKGLSKNVQELRIQFCQHSAASGNLRNFVQKNYFGIKQANPRLPILIREAQSVAPRITARFDFGVEKEIEVAGMSESDIDVAIGELIDSGKHLPKSDESKQ